MFIRSPANRFGRRLSTPMARALSTGVLGLYPLGCVLQLLASDGVDGTGLAFAGLALVVAAVACFLVLAGSSLQRQAQEPEAELDERERADRNAATYVAYSTLSGLVLLGVLYLALSFDLADARGVTLWTPETRDHWNAIFWGLLLAALTLPSAVLAWRGGNDEEADEGP